MDGVCRALGVGPTVWFDGKTCTVVGRPLNFDGLVEAEIVKRRGDPFHAIVEAAGTLKSDGKPDFMAIQAVSEVVTREGRTYRNVTWQEHMQFLNTPFGEALMVWCCLKHNFGPDYSIDRVRWVLGEAQRLAGRGTMEEADAFLAWKAELLRCIDIASGEDQLGNLIGLRPTIPATPTVPDGGPSSGDCGMSKECPPESPAA